MAVDDEHVVAHALVEGELGQYVHAGVAELERDHGGVRLAHLKQLPAASLVLHLG